MGKCYCCESPVSIFTSKRIYGERVCKTCLAKFPAYFRRNRQNIDGITAARIVSRYNADVVQYKKEFVETAKYGLLHIDGVHGLFAICKQKKIDEEGKIKGNISDVYSVLELEDYGLTIDLGNSNSQNATCNVEFSFELSSPHIFIKQLIKRNATCQTELVDSETISIREPSKLTLFRSVFYEAYKSTVKKYNDRADELYPMKHDVDLLKARSLFMLEPDYTKEMLKRQRNRLLKVFHPDEGTDEECILYTQKINDAYHLLAEELKERAS